MAAVNLFAVRPVFVENASKTVLHQLLDDLLLRKVLNDGEVEAVREEHSQRANQARAVIDMVRKKGDRASELMIQCLQLRDPELYQRLASEVSLEEEPMIQGQLR
ncbi:caspase-1-A-like [Conger conger]|uniref:caspase-1-A-like n=1 Tax=Conger conger TaxID=82655 RepID=UPI002A5B063E|nr:caspase-1-A-like [Conger conger]